MYDELRVLYRHAPLKMNHNEFEARRNESERRKKGGRGGKLLRKKRRRRRISEDMYGAKCGYRSALLFFFKIKKKNSKKLNLTLGLR